MRNAIAPVQKEIDDLGPGMHPDAGFQGMDLLSQPGFIRAFEFLRDLRSVCETAERSGRPIEVIAD